MTVAKETTAHLQAKINFLTRQLREANEVISAIHAGQVDAFIMRGADGKQQIVNLRDADSPYQLMVESMNEGAIIVLTDGTILFSNEQFAKLIDVPLENVIGASLYEFVVKDQHTQLADLLVSKKAPSHKKEFTLCHAKDLEIYVYFSIKKLSIDPRKGTFVVVTDITERKQIEDKLNNLVEHLENTGQEMEQFTAIVIENFKAPLRTISSYLQLLSNQYKAQFDANANEYIDYMADAVERLQELLKGLINYVTTSRIIEAPFSSIDCSQLLPEVIDEFKETIKLRKAQIHIGHLPIIIGQKPQIVRVFRNLISNALNFCKTRPRIHIQATEEKDQWVFTIKDNGIGIDPRFFPFIFKIFHQLNPRGAYAGTGTGLAICKKIIQNHGGKIWLQSEPGKGTIFYFSISKFLKTEKPLY